MSEVTTYCQIGFYCSVVFGVTIYCYMFEEEWKNKKSVFSKLIAFGKSLWRKKSCYFPLLLHIIDQSSDLGVSIFFGELSRKEEDDKINCIGISMTDLFIASLFAFFGYRVVSSIVIG